MSFLLQMGEAAQTAGEMVEGAEVPMDSVSIWQVLSDPEKMGWFGIIIVILLAAMSVYTVFIFVERLLALKKANKQEEGFIQKVKEYLVDGKVDSAMSLCARTETPSARMLEKGISRLGKPMESITTSIENTGKLEVLRLEQRISFLATASGAAPMIGFLGTTVGMVSVFIDLQAAATLDIQTIAPGIMTAMITTVAGLIVGITAYMGFNLLVSRISKVVYVMENDALEFMDLLHKPGK